MGVAAECVGTVSILLHSYIWIRILMMQLLAPVAQSERRCYCNDVSCVTTGYMCKSSLGTCFSQTTHDGATRLRFYHACAEMLSENYAGACAGGIEDGARVTARSSGGQDDWTEIVCCATDMCNYREGRSQGEQLRTPLTSLSTPQSDGGGHFVHQLPGDYQRTSADRHIWFQALVIAVSLIGTVVLLFLLVVSVRILVLDHRRGALSASTKSCHVIDMRVHPDEGVRFHVTGSEAEVDRNFCWYDEEEKGGRKEERKEGKREKLGCGKAGADVGGKVFPVSYQCVAFVSGENAFRTDLVPHHHHHHAYLHHHHHLHHCRHYPYHCHTRRDLLCNPHENCGCPNNDAQCNESPPRQT